MTALDNAIIKALETSGNNQEANKAYLEFIKANFIIPVEKSIAPTEEPRVLFLEEHGQFFLPVFTTLELFNPWAADIQDDIQVLKLTGVNLLKGIEPQVSVCLNIGSPYYKEFNPAELARMKSMVIKFFQD